MLVAAFRCFERFAHELVRLRTQEHHVGHEEAAVGGDEEDGHQRPDPLTI